VSNAVSQGIILADDYSGPVTDVMPTADPSVTSDAQRVNQAVAIAQRVQVTPGLYDRYQAEYTFLKAMKVTNIDKVLPDPNGPNAVPVPGNPKLEIEQLKAQSKAASDQLNLKVALLKLMSEAELNQAKIQKLEAEAEVFKIGVLHEGEKLRLQEINTQIGMARERREGVLSAIHTMNSVFKEMMQSQPSTPELPAPDMMGAAPTMEMPQ
jgi:hypothetical protein